MEPRPYVAWRLVLAITFAFLTPPLLLNYAFIERTPSVSPERALSEAKSGKSILLDIRSTDEFEALRLKHAISWPHDSSRDLPGELAGKRVIVYCDSGILSARFARELRRRHGIDAVSLDGGFVACARSDGRAVSRDDMRDIYDRTGPAPFRDLSAFDQWTLVITGFVVKPLYMLGSLLLIVVLRRRRESDLAALRWGMVAFLAGEAACAVNYLVCNDGCRLTEYLHSCGMLVAFAFVIHAFLDGLDSRVVRYSDAGKRCAFLALCADCYKHAAVECSLKRLFLFLIPCCVVLATMPLFVSLKTVSYNTEVTGTLYNISHAVVYQLFESRYCPIASMLLLSVAFLILLLKKDSAVKVSNVWFSAGMGAFCFGTMRAGLLSAYIDRMAWFSAWEEIIELLSILGVGLALWLFRERLWKREGEGRPDEATAALDV